MIVSLRALKIFFVFTVGSFLIATLYISALVVERQELLREISHYNPAFQVSQAVTEFMRLERHLVAFEDQHGESDKDEVLLRYDIILNRTKILLEGAFQTFVQSAPDHQATLRNLASALAAVQPLMETLDRPGAARQALEVLAPLEPRLIQLASFAHNLEAERVARDQQELIRLHWLFSGLAISLILFGIVMIALLNRHNRLLGKAHADLHVLAGSLAHAANHDALTDLPNRVLFREKLEVALQAFRQQGRDFAVLCLDLDRFKNVNDALGHEVGDYLLKVVADRLRGCLGTGDIAARLGGDEFAILQQPIESMESCAAQASRIVEELSAPYVIDGHEIVIGTSIGIAAAGNGIVTPDQLLKHADLALYEAKSQGRGTFRYFEPEMEVRLHARRILEVDLRRALAHDEFELFYQPQINIETEEISGFEALLRWHHPLRGMISPAEFIPIAEDIGLISPLGEWVLNQACAEASKWPRDMKVAVNLSPLQFRSRTLVQSVSSALARTGLSPDRLELEITESSLLQENEATLAVLYQLRRLGVRIAMDDFGTGYSSVGYLRGFPFDKIKIDQSFVRDIPSQADSFVIVQSIASLGAGLRMSTVAEGVETEDQFRQIRAAGCTEAQGYYFGRPKPARELVYTLKSAHCTT